MYYIMQCFMPAVGLKGFPHVFFNFRTWDTHFVDFSTLFSVLFKYLSSKIASKLQTVPWIFNLLIFNFRSYFNSHILTDFLPCHRNTANQKTGIFDAIQTLNLSFMRHAYDILHWLLLAVYITETGNLTHCF